MRGSTADVARRLPAATFAQHLTELDASGYGIPGEQIARLLSLPRLEVFKTTIGRGDAALKDGQHASSKLRELHLTMFAESGAVNVASWFPQLPALRALTLQGSIDTRIFLAVANCTQLTQLNLWVCHPPSVLIRGEPRSISDQR